MMHLECSSFSGAAKQVMLHYRRQTVVRLLFWINYSTTVAIPWLQLQHLLLFSEVLVQYQCDLLWRLNVKRSVHSTKQNTYQNKNLSIIIDNKLVLQFITLFISIYFNELANI